MADEIEIPGGIEGTVRAASPFTAAELRSRAGHDPAFLGPGIVLPLPATGSDQNWLPYTHFSVLLDRSLRQTRLTVVNIDGGKTQRIKRGRDTWYPDPRLPANEQPEAGFFMRPDPAFQGDHNWFGFGHMVRREDPCWGEPGEAALAERETYHLTNASPQFEGLNSGTWRVLEDVVLGDVRRLGIRVVVLTGPVFADGDPMLHGAFRIPRAYWKIVAWRSGGALAAVGWRQAQPEESLPGGLEAASLPFDGRAGRAWLLPVAEIAQLTGLDLAVYAAADTFSLRQAGAEAMHALPAEASSLLLSDMLPLDDALPAALGMTAQEISTVGAALALREAVQNDAPGSADPDGGAEAIGGTPADAAARVSPRAYALIVQHETGGQAYYEQVYKSRPVWPKGASGVTIGFGYDLGYVTPTQFARDWAALPPTAASTLSATIGRNGSRNGKAEMQALLASVRHIPISWVLAETVFRAATLPRFAALTDSKLPHCELLPGDCFGALVSLTFNRGAPYDNPDPRYAEMRAIKAAMASKRFQLIPGLLRDMIRVWVGTEIETEMRRRRTNEAALFEAGLGSAQGGAEQTGAEQAAVERPTPNSGDDMEALPSGGIEGLGAAVVQWRVARSLDHLRLQVNALAPHRNRASDGGIGDAAHATRDSDHNPWVKDGGMGVVTARDFTHDPAGGCDAGLLAQALLASRDPRLKYVIWNRRIAYGAQGPAPWAWGPYSGKNPHTHHTHVSVLPNKALFDSEADWVIGNLVS